MQIIAALDRACLCSQNDHGGMGNRAWFTEGRLPWRHHSWCCLPSDNNMTSWGFLDWCQDVHRHWTNVNFRFMRGKCLFSWDNCFYSPSKSRPFTVFCSHDEISFKLLKISDLLCKNRLSHAFFWFPNTIKEEAKEMCLATKDFGCCLWLISCKRGAIFPLRTIVMLYLLGNYDK